MSLPLNKVQDIVDKHSELEKELSGTNLDSKLFAEKSKEYSNLNEIIKFALEYLGFEKSKGDLEKIISDNNSDDEMVNLAKVELDELGKKYNENELKLKIFLLQKMRQIRKMQFLRLELEQVDLRLVYLHPIYLKCMKKFVIKKNGVLK